MGVRLEWPTGTITQTFKDKDNLVRRVIVQPHKRQGQTKTPQPKERAIHDLVLLKAVSAKDNPGPDDIRLTNAPAEARALLSNITIAERELFSNDPNERPQQQPKKNQFQQTKGPRKEPLTNKEISYLQNTASALLQKIQTSRTNKQPPKLNPLASPFKPTPKTTQNAIPTTKETQQNTTHKVHAQLHSPPPIEWDKYYSHTYNDQGQIKHALNQTQ